jgi:5-formyltetrahydrofolate cyclo-ligase
MKTKSEFRQIFKNRRDSLGERLAEAHTKNICNIAQCFIEEKFPKSNIHLYLPIKKLKEVDTFGLLEMLQNGEYKCFSSISDFNTRSMNTVYLPKGSKFVADEKGIPVPKPLIFAKDVKLNLVILPLLGYDRFGTRLGYGYGYYDRFLTNLDHEPFKLGLSYFPPEERLPSEAHDVKMNACICPEGVIMF